VNAFAIAVGYDLGPGVGIDDMWQLTVEDGTSVYGEYEDLYNLEVEDIFSSPHEAALVPQYPHTQNVFLQFRSAGRKDRPNLRG
jgi:hypothetical protein